MGGLLWECKGESPQLFLEGSGSLCRNDMEENFKEFPRLRTIFQKCGIFWTKKWKTKFTVHLEFSMQVTKPHDEECRLHSGLVPKL